MHGGWVRQQSTFPPNKLRRSRHSISSALHSPPFTRHHVPRGRLYALVGSRIAEQTWRKHMRTITCTVGLGALFAATAARAATQASADVLTTPGAVDAFHHTVTLQ